MSRRLFVLIAVALLAVSPSIARTASAQDHSQLDLSAAVRNAVVPSAPAAAPEQLSRPYRSDLRQPGPSPVMLSLYASTAIMQALDVHSTLTALGNGAVEANPLLSGVTGRKAAFIALKAGVAFSTVMAAHNMARHNKVAAIVSLVAIDSAYAMIISHNYKVARSLR